MPSKGSELGSSYITHAFTWGSLKFVKHFNSQTENYKEMKLTSIDFSCRVAEGSI